MSPRASRPCATPGCPELVNGKDSYCPEHKPKPWAGNQRRARQGRKSGWQEQNDNRRILRAHAGICHVCGGPNATEVDHVIPISEGGTDDARNRRPIHPRPCHIEKTKAEAARARARAREARP